MNRRNFIKSAALAGVAGVFAQAEVPLVQAADRSTDIQSIRSHHPAMRYRTFGKTGEKVSVLGYGTMRFATIGNDYTKIDIPLATRLVRHAVDNGLNYIDTSWPYHSGNIDEGGSSEPFVGKVVGEIGRDKVYIATKLPIWAVRSRADMDRILDAQLRRLNTDHVDFYLVHSIRKAAWDSVVGHGLKDFLDKARQNGKVRHVGFSFHDIPETYQEVMDFYDWSFNQHVCNYYDVNLQAGMWGIRQAALRDYGFVAMEPLMGGALTTHLPQEALDVFAATGIDRSLAGWALRWVWNQPEVSVLLSGMNSMEQLTENLRLAGESDTPLTPAEAQAVDAVRAILKGKGPIACTECGVCSCPLGVGIQMCFEMYNANHVFKIPGISHHNYGQSVKPTLRAASRCDGCGRCKAQCPAGLDIPAELQKVAEHFENAGTGW